MRRVLLLVLGAIGAVLLLSACDLSPLQTIVVTTTVDGRDAVPGDGVCEVTVGAHDCSLRAAVDEANAAPVRTRVLLSPSTTYALTLVGSDDSNAAGDLDVAPVSGSMTIEAPAPGATIDAGAAATGLDVRSGANVDHRVGVTSASSAGIVVRAGAILGADRVSVHGNEGAGIRVAAGGGLNLDASTVSTNGGAGVTNAGTATLRSSTVTRNHGGLAGSAATLTTSIVGDQVAGADCATAATSRGGNLDSDGSCALGGPGDLSDVSPQLGPLAGPGPAHVPDAGSPAIDSVPYGTGGCVAGSADAVDQRGTARPNGFGCDRGAIEVPRPTVTVTSAADGVDAAPGNGTCATAGGVCTLRAAIQETNARPGADAVIVGDVDPVLTVAGAGEDAAATGDLDITDDLLLIGRGRTVSGAGLDRVVELHGDRVTIDALTVTGGGNVSNGGGIRISGGTTVLQSSVLRANTASDYGGGIAHLSGTLLVDHTWIDANRSSDQRGSTSTPGGGGLYVGTGDVTVVGSTFTGNESDYGAGILNQGLEGQHNQLTVSTSTIVRNVGVGIHGGHPALGVNAMHVARVTSSTIADNIGEALTEGVYQVCHPYLGCGEAWHGGGIAVQGSIVTGGIQGGARTSSCQMLAPPAGRGSLGYNVTDGSCGPTQPTDVVVDRPLLGPLLAEAGSAVPVRRPFATSAALDLIPAGTPSLCDASTPVDQVGAPRPAGGACDAGSVEGGNGISPSPRVFVVSSPDDGIDAVPADGTCATATGACTLRAAFDEANAWPGVDTVAIAAGVDPELSIAPSASPYFNGSGSIQISEQVTLDGGGASVDANGIDRAFSILSTLIDPITFTHVRITGGADGGVGGAIYGHHVVLDHAVIEGNAGSSQGGGGIFAVQLDATDSELRSNTTAGSGGGFWAIRADLERVVVADNQAFEQGGGGFIWIGGSVDGSTFEHNLASLGGGLATTGATGVAEVVSVDRSTFTANSATTGGALYAADPGRTLRVSRSTVAANTATDGAGIATSAGTVEVVASTVAGNSASSAGGVVGGSSGTVSFRGSALWSGTGDCGPGPQVTSAGSNVGGDASCALLADPTDLVGVDPLLGPLADNGGPTRTRLPFAGSPVLDRIPTGLAGLCDGALATDQRGSVRPAGAACDVGAVEGHSATSANPLALTVTVAADGRDANPGDGLCATAASQCTLRAAIDETNAVPGQDQVTIAAGIDPVLAIAGRDETANTTGDLDVLDALVLHGGGATVSAGGLDRVLDVYAASRIERVTLANGEPSRFTAGKDGAVIATAADLELQNVTVALGTTSGSGGGLAVSAGTTTVVASTFSLGSATTGGAIAVSGGSVSLAGSVVDGSAPRCVGAVVSLGRNVVGDSSCGAGATDVVADPLLGPLRSTGGFDVHLPYTGSPALNAVPAGTPGLCDGSVPTDERGVARPAGGACDAGATEGGVGFAVPPAATLTVNSDADGVDALPGNGICATSGGACTVRAAIDEANARPGPDTVTFDAARTVTLTRVGPRESGNRTGDLDAEGDLTILGNGSIIDGGNLDRVLHQRSGRLQAELVTFRRGRVADVDGRGGVLLLAHGGSLDRSVVSGGQLVGGGVVAGGGIASEDGTVTITRSTVTGNTAGGYTSYGGGVSAVSQDESDRLVVASSTIAGNGAFAGAALDANFITLNSTITASTIAGGGGGFTLLSGSSMPAFRVSGSIVDWTGLGSCGLIVSDGWNVFSDTCWWTPTATSPTDVVAPSGLGALAANGGPTPTRLPAPGSVPIGFIPVGTPGLCDAATGPDQRGIVRPQGAACDAGAVEQ